jgi:dihydroorotase
MTEFLSTTVRTPTSQRLAVSRSVPTIPKPASPITFTTSLSAALFDVGHGIGSFTWRVARAALEQGFPPTTISSDVHAHNLDGPVFDQPTTLSKLLHLGLPAADVVRASTSAAAGAIRREDGLGSLSAGGEADITVLELVNHPTRLTDGAHESVVADQCLVPRWVVRRGEPFEIAGTWA